MSVQQTDQSSALVYPASETNPPSHGQSDGSFGAVFIVLAVIVVVSAVACVLGRFCNRRYNKPKPSKHGRYTKEKDMKPNRNAFQTKDGDIEYGFDKRFSSAKVTNDDEPNMGRPNSFHEQNMGPNLGQFNPLHEPHMGRPNSSHEANMGRPNSFHEANMGRPNLFHEANMGRPNSFREQNMGPNLGRPNSFGEPNLGPNIGRPDSFREPPMGRTDSFHEPSMGRPNSFRKGEFRDDHVRFGDDENHQIKFYSSTGPQYY